MSSTCTKETGWIWGGNLKRMQNFIPKAGTAVPVEFQLGESLFGPN